MPDRGNSFARFHSLNSSYTLHVSKILWNTENKVNRTDLSHSSLRKIKICLSQFLPYPPLLTSCQKKTTTTATSSHQIPEPPRPVLTKQILARVFLEYSDATGLFFTQLPRFSMSRREHIMWFFWRAIPDNGNGEQLKEKLTCAAKILRMPRKRTKIEKRRAGRSRAKEKHRRREKTIYNRKQYNKKRIVKATVKFKQC